MTAFRPDRHNLGPPSVIFSQSLAHPGVLDPGVSELDPSPVSIRPEQRDNRVLDLANPVRTLMEISHRRTLPSAGERRSPLGLRAPKLAGDRSVSFLRRNGQSRTKTVSA